MLNKKEIIEKFLFEGNIEEQKEKFEIAWDIRENFDEIKKEMREKVLTTLVSKIKNSEELSNYKISDDGFLEGQKHKPLRVYKKSWYLEVGAPLSYGIEADESNYCEISIGIVKWNNKGIPFKGDWKSHKKIPSEWKDIFYRIYENLSQEEKTEDWKTEDDVDYIVWKWFNSPYDDMRQKEFYLEVIEKGYEAVANYYFNELLNLKKLTENLIDEFVEIYKKSQRTD